MVVRFTVKVGVSELLQVIDGMFTEGEMCVTKKCLFVHKPYTPVS